MDNRTQYAVNLESDKHIVTIKILVSETKDKAYSETIQYIRNYIKNFIVKHNGLTHYKNNAVLFDEDVLNIDSGDCRLKDGYYVVKNEYSTKLILYNVETEIIPGYWYNGVNKKVSKVFELYANEVGNADLIRLDKPVDYNDVVTELNNLLDNYKETDRIIDDDITED